MDDLICPHCGKKIHLSDAFRHQVEDSVEKNLRQQFESDKKNEIDLIRKDLEEEYKGMGEHEIKDLKLQIEEKEKKVKEMREFELKLREEKRLLEDKEKDLELETQRRIDEEKKKIEDAVLKQTVEEHRLKDLEKDKQISGLQERLEEALRKSKVGSQQLQGEILELDIENLLRETFTQDEVEPVEKGVKGADLRQIVKSPKGYIVGVILWEVKRTKAWTDSWVSKLKSDLRKEKSNIPVIISITLPKNVDGFGFYDGVWVTSFSLVVPLALVLRKNLLDVAYQKAVSVHKGDKSENLYEYITSHEFRQQVEAMVEVYRDMQSQLEKERTSFERIWKVREGQLQRLLGSTANVVGSIQGKVGQTALPIKGLDLLEEGE
ncbi:MAG TPA: DUF2130 domain-containing protein [Patescibacteria group bacterium]|nr:DUF2130 domain-containing protein [Patescibacteria group bacterium]